MRYWTAEEDATIVRMASSHRICDIAVALGRARSSTRGRMELLARRGVRFACYRLKRKWTDEEDEELLYLTRTLDIEKVAERMGRTAGTCQQRLMALTGPGGTERLYLPVGALKTAEVARLFGEPTKKVLDWIQGGHLRCHIYGPKKRPYSRHYCLPEDIRAFIRDRPEHYVICAMGVSAYRRYAMEEAKRRETDPTMTVYQVAAMKGVSRNCVERALWSGRLAGQKRCDHRQQWSIRREDAERWHPDTSKWTNARRERYARETGRKVA